MGHRLAGAGRGETALFLATIWWLKIAPRPAMPVAIPIWRKVEFAPEAMPLRWNGTGHRCRRQS